MEKTAFKCLFGIIGITVVSIAHPNMAYPQSSNEPGQDPEFILEPNQDSDTMYSCDVFLELKHKQRCEENRNETLEQQRKFFEGEPGDFIRTIKSENLEVAEDIRKKQLENQAVLDHLYEQVYYYRSGVFNYEKKIN